MESLTVNLSGGLRRERWQGREYLVAPLSMIVPGVLNGSQGALFYPPDEIRKSIKAWDGIPITVYHPKGSNGSSATADDPLVLKNQGVGTVRNPSWRDGLKAEGWFDTERVKNVDEAVLRLLEKSQPFELSTGLYTRNEPAENGASYLGRSYTHVARDYRPDHLAVLPGQVGACSVQDGCGVLVNRQSEDPESRWDQLEDEIEQSQTSNAISEKLLEQLQDRFGEGVKVLRTAGNSVTYKVRGKTYRLSYSGGGDAARISGGKPTEVEITENEDASTENQLSSENLHSRLTDLLRERLGGPVPTGAPVAEVSPYVVDVYLAGWLRAGAGSPYLIYEHEDKTYRLGFSVDGRNDEVTLSGEAPTEVQRVTKYEPVGNETENYSESQPRDSQGQFGSGGGGGAMAPDTGGTVQGGTGKGGTSPRDMTPGQLKKSYRKADKEFAKASEEAWAKPGNESLGVGDLVQSEGPTSRLGKASQIRGDLQYEFERRGLRPTTNATKTIGGKALPSSAFAYVPDPDKSGTWKLRIDDAAHVGGAIAAIGKGFRGQKVSIPPDDLPGVRKKIRAAWLKYHPDKSEEDLPKILTNTLWADAELDNRLVKGRKPRTRNRRKPMDEKQRKKLEQYVVANCGYCDEEMVENMEDDQLQGQYDLLQKVENLDKEVQELKKGKEKSEEKPKPTENQEDLQINVQRRQLTTEEWLTEQPEEVRQAFTFAKNQEMTYKKTLIEKIVENTRRENDKAFIDRLKGMEIGDLEQWSQVTERPSAKAEMPTVNWFGQNAPAAPKSKIKPKPLPLNAEYEMEVA